MNQVWYIQIAWVQKSRDFRSGSEKHADPNMNSWLKGYLKNEQHMNMYVSVYMDMEISVKV